MDLSELSAFAASLNHLDREEIQKAKVLFIKNEILKYKTSYKTQPLFLIWIGFICTFMFFGTITVFLLFAVLPLFFFYMAFSSVKTNLKNYKQQIANALEIWKEDLGDDYTELKTKLEKIKSNIPIISAFLNE